jgi:hypothetical protein
VDERKVGYGVDPKRSCCRMEANSKAVRHLIDVARRWTAYLVKMFDKLRVFVGDVLLDKGRRFEKFLARFTPELALVFLLDEWFDGLGQFPGPSYIRTANQSIACTHKTHSS